jgi:glycerol-3-phosphate acyltransferase PlsX
MTVIAIDAMGGDDAPGPQVAGGVEAAARGIEVVLVGDSEILGAELNRLGGSPSGLRIAHAPDVIGMDDKAATEVRRRRDSSIMVGMDLLKREEAAALVSVGNTGAALAAALVVLGRIKGVERPALSALLPTRGGPSLVLDVGANADARPSHLVQFARLGTAYMRSVYGVADPRVGLLSIGEEESKGSSLTRDTHAALSSEAGITFAGNVEGRDIVQGTTDVVVTDGFTGNVALKLLEGTISLMFEELRGAAEATLMSRVGGFLLRSQLSKVRDRLDYRQYGAVPMLGLDGAVFIGHGRSDAHAMANATSTAAEAIEHGMLDAVSHAIVGD